MGYKIYDDGAVIRIENGTSVLFVTKAQVKTIDTIANGIVRLDIGEGPLKNVFLKWSDVEDPVTTSAAALRDVIKNMMPNLSEETGVFGELTNIKNAISQLNAIEGDFLKTEPSRIDESQPNAIYRGWHKGYGFIDHNEWAIERIRRDGDDIIHEWAMGTHKQIHVWTERLNYQYYPYGHDLPIEDPLPQ